MNLQNAAMSGNANFDLSKISVPNPAQKVQREFGIMTQSLRELYYQIQEANRRAEQIYDSLAGPTPSTPQNAQFALSEPVGLLDLARVLIAQAVQLNERLAQIEEKI